LCLLVLEIAMIVPAGVVALILRHLPSGRLFKIDRMGQLKRPRLSFQSRFGCDGIWGTRKITIQSQVFRVLCQKADSVFRISGSLAA
jgi:hypothetical protein